MISIHALREEGDLRIPACGSGCRYFYPRPPRGGRPCALPLLSPSLPISIHALREEGDPRQTTSRKLVGNFYPRPPRGGRPPPFLTHCRNGQFLSTPSARRATYASRSRDGGTGDFYPRPPRGGRPGVAPGMQTVQPHFYPRPPRGGRRPNFTGYISSHQFLSTPSARRATRAHLINVDVFIFLSTPSARRATTRPGSRTHR